MSALKHILTLHDHSSCLTVLDPFRLPPPPCNVHVHVLDPSMDLGICDPTCLGAWGVIITVDSPQSCEIYLRKLDGLLPTVHLLARCSTALPGAGSPDQSD